MTTDGISNGSRLETPFGNGLTVISKSLDGLSDSSSWR